MSKHSNYTARQSLNKQYSEIKGALAINDVAVGFGKGWVAFAVMSAMASAFSFYQDFYESLGVPGTILLVIALAVSLEFFKHLSIKGMFSDMHIVSRSIVSIAAIGLIGISFYTHYKSIKTFQSNLVTTDLKSEITYQRDLQKVQNSQISSILQTNQELAKAMNNGTSKDDEASSRSSESNNDLIATLQKLSAQNNMTNTNLLLQQSRETAKLTASAILVIFIMIEIMALFSILSKVIIIDNVSINVKEFFGLLDRLDELELNTYESLGYQKVEQTEQRINAVKEKNEYEHQKELKKIAHVNQKVEEANSILNYSEIENLAKSMGIPLGLTHEEMIKAIREKYSFLQENPYSYEQPKPTTVAKNREVVAVKDETTKFLEQLKQNEEVDCEFVEDENNTYPTEQRERALDINLFEKKEQATIRAKWANGMIEAGELLVHSAAVIAIITEELKIQKSEAVTLNLYVNNELKDKKLITQTSRGWVAEVPLFQHETKEIAS